MEDAISVTISCDVKEKQRPFAFQVKVLRDEDNNDAKVGLQK